MGDPEVGSCLRRMNQRQKEGQAASWKIRDLAGCTGRF